MSIDARFVMNRARFVPHAIHKRARRDRPFRIVPPVLVFTSFASNNWGIRALVGLTTPYMVELVYCLADFIARVPRIIVVVPVVRSRIGSDVICFGIASTPRKGASN